MYTNLLLEEHGHVALLTINRPKQLNALNKQTIEELHQAIEKLEKDSKIHAIVLTGSGDKAFVAGADIKEFADFNVEQGAELAAKGQGLLFDYIAQLSTPVIAAVNGYALGGGLELAMACHIRVGSSSAKMGLPEVTLGLIPGYGGTQRLAQIVGKGIAMEMILSAQMIDAQRAAHIGLLNKLESPEELIHTAIEMAKKISMNSGQAISTAITAIEAGYRDGENGFQKEIEAFGFCFGTSDFKEGTQAFLEKRKPNFNK
ncbi:enoyl-CoA hydratase-related protein [Flavobacteriaceae bacterium]|nr:enoyl-CoA hydratase-related protein [Flavobacteriaceae bacterium]